MFHGADALLEFKVDQIGYELEEYILIAFDTLQLAHLFGELRGEKWSAIFGTDEQCLYDVV